jgi:hypothetical protein
MKLSELHTILSQSSGDIKKVFFATAKDEFQEYMKQIEKKGSAIHLHVEKDTEFTFSKQHLCKLYQLFLDEAINEVELNFIVDSLIASVSSFESEYISEQLELLTDPEIHGKIDRNEIAKLLNAFNSEN